MNNNNEIDEQLDILKRQIHAIKYAKDEEVIEKLKTIIGKILSNKEGEIGARYKDEFDSMVEDYRKEQEELKQQQRERIDKYENQISQLKSQHKTEKEELINKYENQINNLQSEKDQKIKEISSDKDKVNTELIQKHKDEIDKYENQISQLKAQHETERNELINQYENQINNLQSEKDQKIKQISSDKEQEKKELKQNYKKKIDNIQSEQDQEKEKLIQSYKSQIQDLKNQYQKNENYLKSRINFLPEKSVNKLNNLSRTNSYYKGIIKEKFSNLAQENSFGGFIQVLLMGVYSLIYFFLILDTAINRIILKIYHKPTLKVKSVLFTILTLIPIWYLIFDFLNPQILNNDWPIILSLSVFFSIVYFFINMINIAIKHKYIFADNNVKWALTGLMPIGELIGVALISFLFQFQFDTFLNLLIIINGARFLFLFVSYFVFKNSLEINKLRENSYVALYFILMLIIVVPFYYAKQLKWVQPEQKRMVKTRYVGTENLNFSASPDLNESDVTLNYGAELTVLNRYYNNKQNLAKVEINGWVPLQHLLSSEEFNKIRSILGNNYRNLPIGIKKILGEKLPSNNWHLSHKQAIHKLAYDSYYYVLIFRNTNTNEAHDKMMVFHKGEDNERHSELIYSSNIYDEPNENNWISLSRDVTGNIIGFKINVKYDEPLNYEFDFDDKEVYEK